MKRLKQLWSDFKMERIMLMWAFIFISYVVSILYFKWYEFIFIVLIFDLCINGMNYELGEYRKELQEKIKKLREKRNEKTMD